MAAGGWLNLPTASDAAHHFLPPRKSGWLEWFGKLRFHITKLIFIIVHNYHIQLFDVNGNFTMTMMTDIGYRGI